MVSQSLNKFATTTTHTTTFSGLYFITGTSNQETKRTKKYSLVQGKYLNQVCRISHSVGLVGSPDAPGDVPRHPACLPPPLLLVLEEEVLRLLSKCLLTLIVNCRQFLVVFKGNKSLCGNSFFHLVNPPHSLEIEERTKQTQNTQTRFCMRHIFHVIGYFVLIFFLPR